MAGLSMTKPSSVLSRFERGSKLNEPMKTWERSTSNVFACRLEPELPTPGRGAGVAPVCAAFMTSQSSTPAASIDCRHFA